MNKYILLVGNVYYPSGWDDFKGYFESVEDAKNWVEDNENDECYRWAEIIDFDKIVLAGSTKKSDYEFKRNKIEWTWDNPNE